MGHFKKLARDQIKTENEPKMKFFDFGAFQKIEKMLSHDKILFHMLFEAFHDTSCKLSEANCKQHYTLSFYSQYQGYLKKL